MAANELADRQGVKELVGDDEGRTRRHFLQRCRPADGLREGLKCLALLTCKRRACLDQMYLHRFVETRHDAGGAQGITHQRAPTRPVLDQGERRGATHAHPGVGAPQPDQLSEDLADFRGSREVPRGPENRPLCVVSVIGVQQTARHVVADAHRTLGAYLRCDLAAEGAEPVVHRQSIAGARRGRQIRPPVQPLRRPARRRGIA